MGFLSQRKKGSTVADKRDTEEARQATRKARRRRDKLPLDCRLSWSI